MFGIRICLVILSTFSLAAAANAQQNLIGNILGGMIQQQNIANWKRVSQQEKTCIDQQLRKNGYNLNQIILQGVPPESPNLSIIRRNCKNQELTKKKETSNEQSSAEGFFPDGRYLRSQADCDKLLSDPEAEFDSILYIKNSGNEISGWEFGCKITSKTKNQNSYNIKASCSGEGEKWKKNTTLKYDGTKYNFGYFSNNENYEFCDKPAIKKEVNDQTPSNNSKSQKTLSVGNRCGAHANINEMINVNEDNARIVASKTKEQAEEACTCDVPTPEQAIKGKELEACIIDEMKRIYETTADCSQGIIVDTNRTTREFTGKITEQNYELLDIKTKKPIDTASYTNYYVTMDQLSFLCPKLICSNKSIGEGFGGCR